MGLGFGILKPETQNSKPHAASPRDSALLEGRMFRSCFCGFLAELRGSLFFADIGVFA